MKVNVEYISAGCNCTYNCMELADNFILYGTNKALAVYDLQEEKVQSTFVAHKGRVNCVRFVKNMRSNYEWAVTCCAGGNLIIWESTGETVEGDNPTSGITYIPKFIQELKDVSITVCAGIQVSDTNFMLGCITSDSRIIMYFVDTQDLRMELCQEINLKKSLATDLAFHAFGNNDVALTLGMDSGSVLIYELNDFKSLEDTGDVFSLVTTLSKHEDWVRCIDFVTLDNGDTLMASGGQDSYIAVWRFTKSKSDQSNFEFQVHQFKDFSVVFDSMIIGHEGWINSLHWNSKGELLSCSSDQSIIIWENSGDIWMEKSRFGVIGGMTPGGYGAKFNAENVVSSGFQGAIQIWTNNEGEWELRPSVTGHFGPISDMDYDPAGHYVVTASEDQTTRVHVPWGLNRWHEISRPQIHGHDLFACRIVGDKIVSGAEEKILRAFQPTEVFYKNLEDTSQIVIKNKDAAKAAFLPALGLSNQSENTDSTVSVLDQTIETRLDEDFIRSQTLWLEVSKLYGHVYEIACIATSPVDPLVASASQASKPQFSAIILWCATRWKNIGEFPFHKLNVTGMEFSPNGKLLLSVSRDRTWAVWKVFKSDGNLNDFKIEVVDTGNIHTRALWVGTWSPCGSFFVTGARDKKLVVWKQKNGEKYEEDVMESFESSVSAAAVNPDGIISIGLESGVIKFYQYTPDSPAGKLSVILKLDENLAHHDTIKRIKFNPKEKFQFASVGADHLLKVFQILP